MIKKATKECGCLPDWNEYGCITGLCKKHSKLVEKNVKG